MTLQWRHTGWSARNFIFSAGNQIAGRLHLNTAWNFNATYRFGDQTLFFQERGFNVIKIERDGMPIGQINAWWWGKPTLKLLTGERYQLTSNFWGKNLKWRDEKNEMVAAYTQATMRSMGKGTIFVKDTLTEESKAILMSSGIFINQFVKKKTAVLIMMILGISLLKIAR